jgi:hypothetical protein
MRNGFVSLLSFMNPSLWKRPHRRALRACILAAAYAFTGSPAWAQPVPADTLPPPRTDIKPEVPPSGDALLTTLVGLIQTLVDQGVLSATKAQDMLRQAGVDPAVLTTAPPPPNAASTPPVIRVPYVPQTVKDELRDELKQEVLEKARTEKWAEPGSLPSWMARFTWYGDVRFRIEREDYSKGNATPQAIDAYYQLPVNTTQTTVDSRNRPRLRARLGMEAAIDEQFKANIRVTTTTGDDATASPVSFNSDQGRYGRPFSAGIDVAYLQWSPASYLQVTGGRITNPYLSSKVTFLQSELIWWRDLALDGLYASFQPRLTRDWSAFVHAGAHPLQTNQTGPYNAAPQQWLYAGQAGVTFKGDDESTFRLGASYFSYVGIQGDPNPSIVNGVAVTGSTLNSLSAPAFRQKGNTMFDLNYFSNPGNPLWGIAGQFKELELDANYEFAHFDPLRIGVDVDVVRNVGFNASQVAAHIGGAVAGLPVDNTGKNGIARPRVNGFQVGFFAGRHEVLQWGDWQAFAGYRFLERDAVVDAFTSPDYHLGGTDQKGPYLGVNFGLGKSVSTILRYSATKSIDAVPNLEINEWFLDFLGRF